MAADGIGESAAEDAVQAMAPRIDSFVVDNGHTSGWLASLIVMRLASDGSLPEELGPLPTLGESTRRVEEFLDDHGYEGLLLQGEAETRRRLVEHYESSFRAGIALMLARVVLGVWPDDAPIDDLTEVLSMAGVPSPRWDDNLLDDGRQGTPAERIVGAKEATGNSVGSDDLFDFDADDFTVTSEAAWDGRCKCGHTATEWEDVSDPPVSAVMVCPRCGRFLMSYEDEWAGAMISFTPRKDSERR